MSAEPQGPDGPDLTAGVPMDSLADAAPVRGRVDGEAVILVRRGQDVSAIGATCSHYGGPLAEGLVVEDTVRCPWHHACFSLRTGEALRAPALNPVASYEVAQRDGSVFVTGRRDKLGSVRRRTRRGAAPTSVAIVGAGAAGNSAAEELRHLGFDGDITLIDRDEQAPYDRPNLSKDYLAGNAPEEWIPLHPRAYYEELGLGPELGEFVRTLHEQHGVVFHLGRTASGVAPGTVVLQDGERLSADFIVAGVGVRPATALAEKAGLQIDNGVVVDAYLETAATGVFAAGDSTRWPDPRGGGLVRIEHWVVAQRQGQAVARTIVGDRAPFTDVPFFWSQHYDISINYVGHAARWDAIEVDGNIEQHDASVRYRADGRLRAVASIFRDRESLEAELAMEHEVRSST